MAKQRRSLGVTLGATVFASASLLQGSVALAEDPVTVTWWTGFTGPDRPVVEEIVDNFNASQDDIVVELSIEPWDVLFQKLLPAYTGGAGPVLLAADAAEIPRYAQQGVWMDIGPFYESGTIDASAFIPTLIGAGQYEGVQYGAPMMWFATVFYYNKEILAAAGYDPENPPATWDELEEAARAMTIDEDGDGTPEQYGFLLATHGSLPYWPMLMWQNGGGVLSADGSTVILDSPETIEAIDRWASLVRDEHISPAGISGSDADGIILAGKAAMYWNGPWMVPGFSDAGFDWGLGQIQAGPAGNTSAIGTVQFMIDEAASPEEQEAAAEFIDFWTSVESQQLWSDKVGMPPVRLDVESSNPHVAEFLAASENSSLFLPGIEQQAQINNDILIPTIQRIVAGDVTAEQGLTEAAAAVRTLLGIE